MGRGRVSVAQVLQRVEGTASSTGSQRGVPQALRPDDTTHHSNDVDRKAHNRPPPSKSKGRIQYVSGVHRDGREVETVASSTERVKPNFKLR
jgi:hypothetical protein